MKKAACWCAFVLWVSLVLHGSARPPSAQTAEPDPFYKGKTIRIIAGFPPGGFYDLWSRLLARHMSKYIPGNPNIIVQSMPGAGSAMAANHIFQVAKPDGLTFGTVSGVLYLSQLAGAPGAVFNWPEFTYIGRTTGDASVLYIQSDLPYKDWRDVRNAKEAIPIGSSGSGSTHIVPTVLRDVLGFNLKPIPGYSGGAPIDAAIERGEVAGSARGISAYVGREPYLTWHKKGFVRAIAQTGKERDGRIDPDVPTVWEIAAELDVPAADLEFMETAFRGFDWLWVYMAPPGLPDERRAILREAFHQALKDPVFLAEGKRMGLIPDPIDPAELQRLSAQVMDVKPENVERVRKLLGR